MKTQRHIFEQIFEDHLAEIQRLIARHTRNTDDKLDLTQEVFIKAYSAFSQFRGDSSISTWLYKIAINVCANAARTRARHGEQLTDEPEKYDIPVGLHDVVDELAHKEDQRLLKQAFRLLSAEQLLVLSLRFSDQLTLPEIAEVVGAPVDTVKSRLRAALTKIQSAYNYMQMDIVKAGNPASIEIAHEHDLDEVLIKGDKGGRIYHSLGSLYLRKGLIEAALKEWSKAQKVAPTFLDAYLASAQQYVVIDQPNKAVDTLETAISKIQNADLHAELAGLYLDIFGDVDQGMHHSTRALELEPSNALVHFAAGKAYFKQAKLQEALTSPKFNQDSLESTIAESWRKSASHFEEAIRLKQVFPEARSFLAMAYLNENQVEQAISESAAAANISGNDELVQYHAGWIHYRVGKLEAAENYLKSSVTSKPTSTKLWLLSYIQSAMKKNEEAFRSLHQALPLAKEKSEKAVISANLSAALMRLNRIDEAIDLAESALRLDPNQVHARCNLAEAHLRRGDKPRIAIDICQEGLHLSPDHICFHRILAEAYYRCDKLQDALCEATTAVELQPEEVHRWLLRAKILIKLERSEEATSDVMTVLDLDPDNEEAKARLNELKNELPQE